jgi:hypothetical protein
MVVIAVEDTATRDPHERALIALDRDGPGPLGLATDGGAPSRRSIGMRLAQRRCEDVPVLVATLLEELIAPADEVGHTAHVRDRAAVICAWSRLVIEHAAQRRDRTAAAIERARRAARCPCVVSPAFPNGAPAEGDDRSGLVTPEPPPPRPGWRFWLACRATRRPPAVQLHATP